MRRQLEELGNVPPSREGLVSGPLHNDDLNLRVIAQLADGPTVSLAHLDRHGIHFLRMVDDDFAGPACVCPFDLNFSHSLSP